jgi:hypothetical protein
LAALGCAAGSRGAGQGGAGTYEITESCDAAICGQATTIRTILVLLESAADERSWPICSRKQGFEFAGCLPEGQGADSKPRVVAWKRDGYEIEVGISCGPDGGDQLLFRAGDSKATWRSGWCCEEIAPGGKIVGRSHDSTFALKRLGAPDPERCRR